VGQGRIADRTQEKLSASDRGIVMIRQRFFDELERIAAGGEPKGLIRDEATNRAVALPIADRESVVDGYTTEEILADPRRKMMFTTYIFQAGQPEHVRRQFSAAMGIEAGEFNGLYVPRSATQTQGQ
jgi:5,5'-dehydrodivanillate O-demethylase oxygenase subunit